MYGGDGAMSDGMEHLSEETSDKMEHPLTDIGRWKILNLIKPKRFAHSIL